MLRAWDLQGRLDKAGPAVWQRIRGVDLKAGLTRLDPLSSIRARGLGQAGLSRLDLPASCRVAGPTKQG